MRRKFSIMTEREGEKHSLFIYNMIKYVKQNFWTIYENIINNKLLKSTGYSQYTKNVCNCNKQIKTEYHF